MTALSPFVSECNQDETALADILPATRSRLKLDGHVEPANSTDSQKTGRLRGMEACPKVDEELCVPHLVIVSLTRTFRAIL